MPRIDWPLVALTGLTGLLPAALAVALGSNPLVAVAAWTALALLVWVPLAVRRAPGSAFATVLGIGTVAGAADGAVEAAFAHVFGDATPAFRAQLFAFALVAGAVWGALFGGVARLVARKRSAA